jgi:hypothetical protein
MALSSSASPWQPTRRRILRARDGAGRTFVANVQGCSRSRVEQDAMFGPGGPCGGGGCGGNGASVAGCGCGAVANDGSIGVIYAAGLEDWSEPVAGWNSPADGSVTETGELPGLTWDGMYVPQKEYAVPFTSYYQPGYGWVRSGDQWATPHGDYARKSQGMEAMRFGVRTADGYDIMGLAPSGMLYGTGAFEAPQVATVGATSVPTIAFLGLGGVGALMLIAGWPLAGIGVMGLAFFGGVVSGA